MGSGTLTDLTDGGYAVLTKSVVATTVAAGTAVTASVTIPVNSQIIDIFVDTLVTPVKGGGTATLVAATVGNVAAGTQYVASTDVIATLRVSPTFTVAQLAAMSDVGSNGLVALTIDPDGTVSTTQGQYQLTVVYAQKV